MDPIEFFPAVMAPLVTLIILIIELHVFAFNYLARRISDQAKSASLRSQNARIEAYTKFWLRRFWGCGYLSKKFATQSYYDAKSLHQLEGRQKELRETVNTIIPAFKVKSIWLLVIAAILYSIVAFTLSLLFWFSSTSCSWWGLRNLWQSKELFVILSLAIFLVFNARLAFVIVLFGKYERECLLLRKISENIIICRKITS